jgi:thioredoxin-related protein
MKTRVIGTFLVLMAVCHLTVNAQSTDTVQVENIESSELHWYNINEAWEANKKDKKILLVDFYTDWCGWCKRMDKTTYNHPVVKAYLEEHFYSVKFDAEQKEDVVIEGATYKYVPEGRRGYNQFAAELMNGKMSYPTVVFLRDNQVITRVPGFKNAKEFLRILEYIVAYNADNTVDWEEFAKSYVSPISEE